MAVVQLRAALAYREKQIADLAWCGTQPLFTSPLRGEGEFELSCDLATTAIYSHVRSLTAIVLPPTIAGIWRASKGDFRVSHARRIAALIVVSAFAALGMACQSPEQAEDGVRQAAIQDFSVQDTTLSEAVEQAPQPKSEPTPAPASHPAQEHAAEQKATEEQAPELDLSSYAPGRSWSRPLSASCTSCWKTARRLLTPSASARGKSWAGTGSIQGAFSGRHGLPRRG